MLRDIVRFPLHIQFERTIESKRSIQFIQFYRVVQREHSDFFLLLLLLFSVQFADKIEMSL